jgi:hypothetical protein
MRKLPEGVRREETRKAEGFSQQRESNEQDSLENSCFEIDLLETGMSPPETNEVKSTEKNELPEEKTVQEKFDQFLIEAIDESLSSLGEPVKNAVYQHLQDDFSIEKDKIPSQIDEFSTIIHKIFGLGASRLEIKFMKNLNSKVEIDIQMPEYEWPLSKWIIADLSFTDYVHNARKNYISEYEKSVALKCVDNCPEEKKVTV